MAWRESLGRHRFLILNEILRPVTDYPSRSCVTGCFWEGKIIRRACQILLRRLSVNGKPISEVAVRANIRGKSAAWVEKRASGGVERRSLYSRVYFGTAVLYVSRTPLVRRYRTLAAYNRRLGSIGRGGDCAFCSLVLRRSLSAGAATSVMPQGACVRD